jgi:lipopolysaccharide export LptBFGC system permease protein LptF
LPVRELAQAARHLRENRQNAARLETLLWGKIAATLSILPLTAAGLCFVAYRRRRVNLGMVGVSALLLGGIYYLLGEIARHLGRFGDAPPAVPALLPLALLIAATAAILYRRERR